jgi:hypothetical protein
MPIVSAQISLKFPHHFVMSEKHTPVKKSSVVRESSWAKQLSVDIILSPTSLKVSGYFSGKYSDNISEHFCKYLILTKKSGKICINFKNFFLGGLRLHLQYQFPYSKFVKFYVNLLLKLSGTDIKHRINLLREL